MILIRNDNKKLIIFLQDIRPFEAVGGAGFLELVQHTVQPQTNRHYTVFIYYFIFFIINYRFIFFFKLAGRGLAGCGLIHLWPTGMGRAWA